MRTEIVSIVSAAITITIAIAIFGGVLDDSDNERREYLL
jgi:hypothetical protein